MRGINEKEVQESWRQTSNQLTGHMSELIGPQVSSSPGLDEHLFQTLDKKHGQHSQDSAEAGIQRKGEALGSRNPATGGYRGHWPA